MHWLVCGFTTMIFICDGALKMVFKLHTMYVYTLLLIYKFLYYTYCVCAPMAWSNKLYKKFKIKKEVNICLVKIVICTYMVYLERIFKWKTKSALKCKTRKYGRNIW